MVNNNANMHAIADQVLALYNAFAAGRQVLTGEAHTLYITARDRLFEANGITYADYINRCADHRR